METIKILNERYDAGLGVFDPTTVNNAGLTTETTVYRVGKVAGPFTKRPSGKFARDGETPIMRQCKPYWIVRVMFGQNGSIMQDKEFSSLTTANEFWASLSE